MKYFMKAFALIAVLLISCISGAVYETAFAVELQDVSNNTVNLDAFIGKKPVLLLFWTTWCPYCRKELKSLEEMYPRLKKDGWEVLAINVGESRERVNNFIKRYTLEFPVLLDKTTDTADLYGILGVPTYIFLNKEEKVVFRGNRFPEGAYEGLISK
ncbi:MAG: TlpA disulfide reductase family protein [Candidatus Omnitrophota bacterium]